MRARAADHREILRDEVGCGDPLRPVVLGAERAQARRCHAELGRAGHEFAELRAKTTQPAHFWGEVLRPVRPCAILELAGEQLAEVAVLLTARDELWGFRARDLRRVADDVEGE